MGWISKKERIQKLVTQKSHTELHDTISILSLSDISLLVYNKDIIGMMSCSSVWLY